MSLKTAKESFLAGPHRAAFEKLAETAAFDAGAEYALLVFIEELPSADIDPNLNWARYSQVTGAKRLLEILRTLHLKQEAPKRQQLPSLKPPQ